MRQESIICQNCKNEFVIEPEDFLFYEKIHVPPPTWCSECRMVRRMTWRNERALYHGICGATTKKVITMFSPEKHFTIYERDYWWSDKWDQLVAGRAYDFSKSFFLQFRELFEATPLPNLANSNVIDSEYGNHNVDMKNCYLTYASFHNENLAYSSGAMNSRDSMDLLLVGENERCYENVLCDGLYNVHFSQDSDDSLDSYFLRSCKDVKSCFGCINLRRKSYQIFNRQYSKEGYESEMKKIDLGSYQKLIEYRKQFADFSLRYPKRHAVFLKCVDVTGDNIVESKNCKICFDVYEGVEDSKYAVHAVDLKGSYDGYGFGGEAELLYEGIDSGIKAARYKFTIFTHGCHDVEYVYGCHASSHLFGCVGLRNKQYCILNKQYTKEEYEKLVPRIIENMNQMPYADKKDRIYGYGEFFPSELSPFAYNESIAQEYFPLTKKEANEKGFEWGSPTERDYKITVQASDLPDHIRDANEGILKEVIGCADRGACNHQCTTAFKIIPDEFSFYKKFNFPLPRLCPNCRYYTRLSLRNLFRLWKRHCDCVGISSANKIYANQASHSHGSSSCPNEFETSYSPEKKDIVYCEACYKDEVA